MKRQPKLDREASEADDPEQWNFARGRDVRPDGSVEVLIMASTRVKVDGRTFIVDFNDHNVPLRIKERKMYGKYPLEGWRNAPYWNAKHHRLGSSHTMTARIVAAALTAIGTPST
jgi:hypothetical protein